MAKSTTKIVHIGPDNVTVDVDGCNVMIELTTAGVLTIEGLLARAEKIRERQIIEKRDKVKAHSFAHAARTLSKSAKSICINFEAIEFMPSSRRLRNPPSGNCVAHVLVVSKNEVTALKGDVAQLTQALEMVCLEREYKFGKIYTNDLSSSINFQLNSLTHNSWKHQFCLFYLRAVIA